MTCTTMSPRSTSTQSPLASPSTPCTRAPPSRSFSCTLVGERACTWRLESPLAITTRSKIERQARDVEDDDVAPLDVLERLDHGALLLADVHYR